MILNVPINGKSTRVVAEGSKGGFFYVLNEKNGSPVPGFKITETPTYDPVGAGHRHERLRGDPAVPDRRVVLHGRRRLLAGRPREVQLPGQPAGRRVRDEPDRDDPGEQPDPADEPGEQPPDLRSAGELGDRSGRYLVYGGAGGGGNFGYPPSAYNPNTTHLLRLRAERGRRALEHRPRAPTSRRASSASATSGIQGFMSAINLSNNTMRWQFPGRRSRSRRLLQRRACDRRQRRVHLVEGPKRPGDHPAEPGHDPAGCRHASDSGRPDRRLRRHDRARSSGPGASRTTRASRRWSPTSTRASSTSRATTASASPALPGATPDRPARSADRVLALTST